MGLSERENRLQEIRQADERWRERVATLSKGKKHQTDVQYLLEEIDRLRAVIDELQNDLLNTHRRYKDKRDAVVLMDREIRRLEEQLKVRTEALEFYADPDNWSSPSGKVGIYPVYTDDFEGVPGSVDYRMAGGKRARKALKGEESGDE